MPLPSAGQKLCRLEKTMLSFDVWVQQGIPTYRMQDLQFRLHTNYFLLPWKIPEELADNQCSSINKSSIYHIKQVNLQLFTMGVTSIDQKLYVKLKEVSIMYVFCTYCLSTLLCIADTHLWFEGQVLIVLLYFLFPVHFYFLPCS